MLFNRAFRHAELLRHLRLIKLLKPVQAKNITRPLRQGLDPLHDQGQLLTRHQADLGIGLIDNDIFADRLTHRVVPFAITAPIAPFAAQAVQPDIIGGAKQEGGGIIDAVIIRLGGDLQIEFLHDVFRYAGVTGTRREITHQQGPLFQIGAE